jgi:hypothetical protein
MVSAIIMVVVMTVIIVGGSGKSELVPKQTDNKASGGRYSIASSF